ncbi:MAG TPA: HlyD family efflux transporter periplasmic adaptor subunit [Vicinamibacterales bacterium]|nr:HlyD family efflux transporter periplasmic adaptor subunit [Vicinamibacterales bacterium]
MGKRSALVAALLVLLVVSGTAFWRRGNPDPSLVAVVRRGPLTATLTTNGTLRPIQSITYRSPVAGRELEISELAPEGTRVNQGDLLVRLDTTELERDVERVQQELRQQQIDLQIAEGEWQEAESSVRSVSEGEGALTVEETRTRLQIAQKRVDRLRQEYEQLKPLMDKGFITRDELAKTGEQLEQAEEELGLARKRADVVVQMTHPRDQQRASLQVVQKQAQVGHARARLQETETRLKLLQQLIEGCRLFARHAGLVVYDEYLNAFPRRKIRVGDRVTNSQGLVTIPEINRMMVESSVGEAEVHRVRAGQTAVVRLEAFPDLRLNGRVVRVGTLAGASAGRPLDDKRFDLIVELEPATADLRPEMTARVDILVGARNDVLRVPLNAIFEEQNGFVVHVVGRSHVEMRSVDLGESSTEEVEVVAGVHENERVMLVDPRMAAASVALPKGTEQRESGNVLQPR